MTFTTDQDTDTFAAGGKAVDINSLFDIPDGDWSAFEDPTLWARPITGYSLRVGEAIDVKEKLPIWKPEMVDGRKVFNKTEVDHVVRLELAEPASLYRLTIAQQLRDPKTEDEGPDKIPYFAVSGMIGHVRLGIGVYVNDEVITLNRFLYNQALNQGIKMSFEAFEARLESAGFPSDKRWGVMSYQHLGADREAAEEVIDQLIARGGVPVKTNEYILGGAQMPRDLVDQGLMIDKMNVRTQNRKMVTSQQGFVGFGEARIANFDRLIGLAQVIAGFEKAAENGGVMPNGEVLSIEELNRYSVAATKARTSWVNSYGGATPTYQRDELTGVPKPVPYTYGPGRVLIGDATFSNWERVDGEGNKTFGTHEHSWWTNKGLPPEDTAAMDPSQEVTHSEKTGEPEALVDTSLGEDENTSGEEGETTEIEGGSE